VTLAAAMGVLDVTCDMDTALDEYFTEIMERS
jgi:hypothetical protein